MSCEHLQVQLNSSSGRRVMLDEKLPSKTLGYTFFSLEASAAGSL